MRPNSGAKQQARLHRGRGILNAIFYGPTTFQPHKLSDLLCTLQIGGKFTMVMARTKLKGMDAYKMERALASILPNVGLVYGFLPRSQFTLSVYARTHSSSSSASTFKGDRARWAVCSGSVSGLMVYRECVWHMDSGARMWVYNRKSRLCSYSAVYEGNVVRRCCRIYSRTAFNFASTFKALTSRRLCGRCHSMFHHFSNENVYIRSYWILCGSAYSYIEGKQATGIAHVRTTTTIHIH